MKAINPTTNEVIREYEEHSSEEIHHILELADHSFKSWRLNEFADRSDLMHSAAGVLRDNAEKYARLITVEMGKIITEARAEVEKCAWVCDYYADKAEEFLDDEIIETDASRSLVSFEPLGVVLAVMPWNFPFWQVIRFIAPAMMAGNACVLKHASNVPGCALAIEEVFREAGFPPNLFRTLMIPSKAVDEVIKSDYVRAVTLTGSEVAGSRVASSAGRELKKTVLELGGSDAFIVLEDANIEKCVATSVKSRMINAGQSCIAAKRCIVVEPVLSQFENEHARLIQSLKIGDPLLEDTQVGPLARMDLLEDLDRQVRKSIEKGAKLLCGGKRAGLSGAFYLPTVLSSVQKGMPVFDEETFGPVSAIIPAKDAEDAVAIANDSPLGLGASIWSEDTDQAEFIARSIESGSVFINGMVKSDPRLPFGGIKKSGYGRELSHYGIREFVNIKTIWIA